jgi:hypothetical protein
MIDQFSTVLLDMNDTFMFRATAPELAREKGDE